MTSIKPVSSIQIDLSALRYNFKQIQSLAPNCHIIAMIKANAYGHGAIVCAQALNEVETFGVARAEEVIALRQAGIKKRIILMQGITDKENLLPLIKLDCELVLHHHDQLKWIVRAPVQTDKKIKIWLKINTGLNRLGLPADDVEHIHRQLANCSHIEQPINFLSHIAWTHSAKHPSINQQQQLFLSITAQFPGQKSLARSGLIVAGNTEENDWVRPGILLYGISPFNQYCGSDFNFRQVMSFHSKLISVRQQKKGDTIGYDASGVCQQDMPVGVVAVGYGDGYPGHAPNGTPILIGGKICPLIGRVAMDMLHVDLRAYPQATVGEKVILWGQGLTVETVARHINTSPYILATNVNHRQLAVHYSTD